MAALDHSSSSIGRRWVRVRHSDPVMIRKFCAYLVKEADLAENAEEKSAEFVNSVPS